jgi:hypothetical protein
MYKNGETAITRVLELTNKCPKELQEKCFELLLAGYVQLELVGRPLTAPAGGKPADQTPAAPPSPMVEAAIPAAALNRFKTTAKRNNISLDNLANLFDFNSDPFTLQPVSLSGNKTADKARQVVLLAAVRSYLASGFWSADWQEVKSLCVDYSCYDLPNHSTNLKQGNKAGLFKAIERGKPIDLTPSGVTKAEELVKSLAGGTSNGSDQ